MNGLLLRLRHISAAARSWWDRRRTRDERPASKRMLVNEILSIQVMSAALIGGLAIAALYWGGQWVLQDNYSRWALQWTEELNELGAPLYLADDKEALFRLESFVERYPEIDHVSYYGRDGEALFTIGKEADDESVARLGESLLEDAVSLVGAESPYLLQSGLLNPREFEILAPVCN